jgi:uncharacterized protein YjdB/N-acetylmuramoyl-L-alanine amidase
MSKSIKKKFRRIVSFVLTLVLIAGVITIPESSVEEVEAATRTWVVTLDPGHGGRDTGATSGGVYEKNCNLAIARYCKAYIETHSSNITVYMTRSDDTYIGSTQSDSLRLRTQIAKNNGSDLFVSIHINSGSSSVSGAEVWIPRYFYRSELTVFGNNVLSNISSATGIGSRGVKTRDCTNEEMYTTDSNGRPNGYIARGEAGYETYAAQRSKLLADYYGVINGSVTKQIPGCIIEHAFITNASDRSKLQNDTMLRALGEADAKAIIKYFESGVKENDKYNNNNVDMPTITTSDIGVACNAHVQDYGWKGWVYNGEIAGTTGEGKRVEALWVYPYNLPTGATITATAHIQDVGWKTYNITSEGAMIGTTGQSKRIEALSFKLNGAPGYVIEYRVHSETFGWSNWASQGEQAGTTGMAKRVEAVQMRIVKSEDKTVNDSSAITTHVAYSTHVQDYGWQSFKIDEGISGTVGRAKRLESIKINLVNKAYSGGIRYSVHCQSFGWMSWVTDGGAAGTTGLGKRLEAIKIELTGEMAEHYDIEYRVHSETYGWLPWVKNGEVAGTTGRSKRLEAIQIRLVAK